MNASLAYYSDLIPFIMSMVALGIVAVEWIVLTITERMENHKEGWTNVASAALSYLPLFILNKFVTIGLMFWLYEYRLFDLSLAWYVWIAAHFGYDFMFFAVHWLSHKVRILWCIHSVHHAPKEMKSSVAFRGSLFDFLVTPHTTVWLVLFGFHPLMIIIIEGVVMLYGMPLHLKPSLLPKNEPLWLRKLFITPGNHRIHHARNGIYLDTNFGLNYTLWDALLKTLQFERKNIPVKYGTVRYVDSTNLIDSQTDEFVALWKDIRSTPRFMDKVKYIFMPPGWNHLDGGLTATEIRQKALAEIETTEEAPVPAVTESETSESSQDLVKV